LGIALTGIVIILLGGACSLFLRDRRLAARTAAGSVAAGSALCLAAAAYVLARGTPLSLHLPWNLPYASLAFEIDALTAFFMVPTALLSTLCAWYGVEYLSSERAPRFPDPVWFFFNALAAGMLLVLTARNAVLFLISWEVMSLAPFFLVTREHQRPDVRAAGLIYLAATHLGTACLIVCFVLLGRGAPNLDFSSFPPAAPASALGAVVFLLGLAGFGAKAGLVPFHVWLPEAHPAAPSHVSALMSGVMIKMGIYGLLRLLTFFDLTRVPLWWGALVTLLGVVSGVMGVLYALGQHDLKRMLAYHSVENIGIITIGLGVALAGRHYGLLTLSVFGLAGALLHVLNHALFKGLLFLGAGAVLNACGTRDLERLGGLLRRMPHTGAAFLLGAIAISGLPPLNGFVSEFLIYFGSFGALNEPRSALLFIAIAAILGLSLIGGLAAACFAKAFGVVFLGEPRHELGRTPADPGAAMQGAMFGLGLPCVLIGLFSPLLLCALSGPVAELSGAKDASALLSAAAPALYWISGTAFLLLAVLFALLMLRRRLFSGRPVEAGPTWDCGYAFPSPRMQYSASSFAAPLVGFFQIALRPRRSMQPVSGYFPHAAGMHTEVVDVFQSRGWRPLFRRVVRVCQHLRWLQPARVQLFAAYIVAVLLLLIAWLLATGGVQS
jgi:hydrogenase-4 component B